MTSRTNFLLSKSVTFKQNAILSREMLQELHDFPHDVFDLFYSGDDAVLCGIDFCCHNEKITISPGLLRKKGALFRLLQPIVVNEVFEEYRRLNSRSRNLNKVSLILRADDGPEERYGVQSNRLTPAIVPCAERQEKDLVLCVFSDDAMPLLPSPDSPKPEDEYTRISRCNMLSLPYACAEASTFHPYVFRSVLNILKNKIHKSTLDYALILELQRHATIPWESIRFYIDEVGGTWPDETDRETVFKVFCKCLREVVSVTPPPFVSAPVRSTTIQSREAKSPYPTPI